MAATTKGDSRIRFAAAYLRFNRRFAKMLRSLDELESLGLTDSERHQHLHLILQHARERVNLDFGEVIQKRSLEGCNQLDREVRGRA